MHKVRWILMVLNVICLLTAQAQKEDSIKHNNNFVIVKLAPLCFFEPTPSAEGAVEYSILPKLSLQHQFGYITTLGYVEHWAYYSEPVKMNGIRIRNELRLYTGDKENGQGVYIAPELLYKKYNIIKEETVGRYNWSYYQIIKETKTKTIYAGHFKAGYQRIIDDLGLVIDVYGGAGMRYLKVETQEYNDETYDYETNWFERVDGNYLLPSLVLGLKIGFVFK